LLFENLKTIIVVAYNYPANVQFNQKFLIAKYATQPDYHIFVKDKLKELSEYITNNFQNNSQNINTKCVVGSSIVMEKQWALIAGLGWQGKNGLIVNENFGSFFYIGIIFLDVDIEADSSVENKCGDCNLCIESCPTNAITQPQVVDCNRCISNYTIEKRTNTNTEMEVVMQKTGYAFGCDICQNVCPYNAKRMQESAFFYNIDNDILDYTEDKFKNNFAQSPILRAGFEQFIQNIKIVTIQ
jgi:epoxyqueuosine reductase